MGQRFDRYCFVPASKQCVRVCMRKHLAFIRNDDLPLGIHLCARVLRTS